MTGVHQQLTEAAWRMRQFSAASEDAISLCVSSLLEEIRDSPEVQQHVILWRALVLAKLINIDLVGTIEIDR